MRTIIISLCDNGGATIGDTYYCNYCQGERDLKSSDSPSKAIVFLRGSRKISYGVRKAVQNELGGHTTHCAIEKRNYI